MIRFFGFFALFGALWSPCAWAVQPNTLPVVSDVALSPPNPWIEERVRCVYTFHDDDGDPDRSTIRWYINDEPIHRGRLLRERLAVGDVVRCEVVPNDGHDKGPPVSHEVRIGTNVLILLVDDLGVDKLAAYAQGTSTPPTPSIDRLADEGVLFERAYAQPLCSPTRAAILTGRHSYRHGVGYPIAPDDDFALSYDEEILPERVAAGTNGLYDSSYIGKWHLSSLAFDIMEQPVLAGWAWYAGSLFGVGAVAYTSDALPQDWFDWERVELGVPARSTTYVMTSNVDDALARASAMEEPWLMQVGFVGVHKPFHEPPATLRGTVPLGSGVVAEFHWMVEALDTELGNLLDGIDPEVMARTTVILMSDNGTNPGVVEPPLDAERQKGTVYEGGVHVPLIIKSPLVAEPGRRVDHLAHAVDLFATVAEVTGAGLSSTVTIDGVSLLPILQDPLAEPVRDTVYAESFSPSGFDPPDTYDQMIRNDSYKLVIHDGVHELYDLRGVMVEGDDLLAAPLSTEAQEAYDELVASLPEGAGLGP